MKNVKLPVFSNFQTRSKSRKVEPQISQIKADKSKSNKFYLFKSTFIYEICG